MRAPRGAAQVPSSHGERLLGQRGACRQQSWKAHSQRDSGGPRQPSAPRKTPHERKQALLTACQALLQHQRRNSARLCPAPCCH